jgi:uncharacterized protein (DUF1501 family)
MIPFLDRRALLRAGFAAATLPAVRGVALAQPGQGGAPAPLLVLVNLRGGMDGLHVLSPADDRNLVDKRPPELRTLTTGPEAGHRLDASGDIDFRLHPRAAGLARIWSEGRMAIWPAAGVPEATRSHFEAQELLGLGIGRRSDGRPGRGWLAGWAQALAGVNATPLGTLAAMGALPPELSGARGAVSVPGLAGGVAPPGGPFGARVLDALYRGGRGPAAEAGREALALLGGLDARLPRDGGGQILPYRAPAGVVYPNNEFGRGLAVVAQLARLVPELGVATLDIGGWDMHESQPWRMRDVLGQLDDGLAALDADLLGSGRRWSVVMASEFGRRLRSNRSQGTDHGRAGLVMAFGDRGFGPKRGFGPWPGLAPDALEEGVDLRVVTDYREAVTRVLADLAPHAPRPFAA